MTKASGTRLYRKLLKIPPRPAPAPTDPSRDHADKRFAYSRTEIVRSLKFQIERDGGIFLGINLKKEKFSWVDKHGNKKTAPIEYA